MAAAARQTTPDPWETALDRLEEIETLTERLIEDREVEKLSRLVGKALDATKALRSELSDAATARAVGELTTQFVGSADSLIQFIRATAGKNSVVQSRQRATSAFDLWTRMRSALADLYQYIDDIAP